MAEGLNWRVVVSGIAVHLVLTYSVIDIHFQTPIIAGIPPVPVTSLHLSPPAKRLLLFVADGLRADKFFQIKQSGEPRAPFLYSQANHGGRYGIAHTRPPTESRPGHVAMAAGFYEDPSALLSGWKVNPVKFDSVFNRSRTAWGLGAPDVVPLFEGHGSYEFEAYSHEMVDFSAEDLGDLDVWVFDKVGKWLDGVMESPDHPFRQGPSILFLHLLGLDSNGHAHGGPWSWQYLENIELVDREIEKLVGRIESLFPDKSTAYIFTADHGMTDQASHGDGAPENTETPLVLWGSGIRRVEKEHEYLKKESLADDWGYSGPERSDIQQAEIAPLIAALIGVSMPVNCLFSVPIDLVGGGDEYRAHAACSSASQLTRAYYHKAAALKEKRLRFVHYHPFVEMDKWMKQKLHGAFSHGHFGESMQSCQLLAETAMRGLDYLQRYDWLLLSTVVTLGFISWMGFLLSSLIVPHPNLDAMIPWRLFSGLVLSFCWSTLFWIRVPATYFAYFSLPCILIPESLGRLTYARQRSAQFISTQHEWRGAVSLGSTLLCLVVLSYGFVHRALLFLVMIALGIHTIYSQKRSACLRSFSFLVTGLFALIPVGSKPTSPHLVALSGILGFLMFRWGVKHMRQCNWVMTMQQVFIMGTIFLVGMPTHKSTEPGLRHHLVFGFTKMQCLFWIIFAGGILAPRFSQSQAGDRIQCVFLSILTSFMIVSLSWEPIFLCSLSWSLWSWYSNIDSRCPKNRPHSLSFLVEDVVDALYFIVLVNLGFFGQGNSASVASFDIESVYRLTHVFNPFIMGSILVVKNIMPLIVVMCVYIAVLRKKRVSMLRGYTLVVLLSDVMSLRFFYQVKGTGSWLEIGTSLGFYGIMNAQVIVVLALFGLSRFLMVGDQA